MRETVGELAEELIAEYDSVPWVPATLRATKEQLDEGVEFDAHARDVLLMRLANTLEEHLDLAMLYSRTLSCTKAASERSFC